MREDGCTHCTVTDGLVCCSNKVPLSTVPRVVLPATHEQALQKVSLSELEEFGGKRDGPDDGLQFWLSGDKSLEKKIIKDEDPTKRKPSRNGDEVAT